MKKNEARTKKLTTKEVDQIRLEEARAGIPAEFRTPKRLRVLPRDRRRRMPPEAFEDRNTKVRITMHVDLDVLNYFKARAAKTLAPYQSLINAELRRIMEADQVDDPASVTRKLKEARTLIDTAIRAVQQ
jgi:uncharacterized protein (DUF4415 family)